MGRGDVGKGGVGKACVGRTFLSDAFDFDLDFGWRCLYQGTSSDVPGDGSRKTALAAAVCLAAGQATGVYFYSEADQFDEGNPGAKAHSQSAPSRHA